MNRCPEVERSPNWQKEVVANILNYSSANQPSGTAQATAFLRALATNDPRPALRCPDLLVEIFLD